MIRVTGSLAPLFDRVPAGFPEAVGCIVPTGVRRSSPQNRSEVPYDVIMERPGKVAASSTLLVLAVVAFSGWSVVAYRLGSSPFAMGFENVLSYGGVLKRLWWLGIASFLFVLGSSLAVSRTSKSSIAPVLCFLVNVAAILIHLWPCLRALDIWYQMGPDEPFTLF